MSDLLLRLSNAGVLPNGNLRWRVETQSDELDVECASEEIGNIVNFLIRLAAGAERLELSGPDYLVSLPAPKFELHRGATPTEVMLVARMPGGVHLAFPMSSETVSSLARGFAHIANQSGLAGSAMQ